MTQPGYRHRILIIDRSGSIKDIRAGQQSGLEEFLRSEQQVPGRVTVSLWDFDTEIRCVHSMAAAGEVLGYRIEPRNATAMNDAIGDAVESEGAKLAALPEDERPEDVTVIISSDGLENSSQRRTRAQVKEMLTHQQEAYGWRVLWMGTNQDVLRESASSGVTMDMAVSYTATSTGSVNAWAASAMNLARVPVTSRAAGQSIGYSEEERALGESDR
jgi:hypothetical protein